MRVHVPFLSKIEISSCIAETQPGCFNADLSDFGSLGISSAERMYSEDEYFELGLTMPDLVLVSIKWLDAVALPKESEVGTGIGTWGATLGDISCEAVACKLELGEPW